MSRTVRRKNCHFKSIYISSSVDEVFDWELKRWNVKTPEAVIVRQTARFHGDHGTVGGNCGVPQWYRRRLNKQVDRANKKELLRCRTADCWEDFLPHRYLSNAAYNYW